MPVKECLIQRDVTNVKQAINTYKPATQEKQLGAERKIVTDVKKLESRSDMSPDKDYYRFGGKWYLKGKPVSGDVLKKLNKMAIPPAWDNALISTDSGAKIRATGIDKAGQWQARYSTKHVKQKDKEKFDRAKLLGRDLSSIRKNVNDGVLKEETNAMLMRMEDKTVIRIGGKLPYEAKKKAYGLTTLRNEHVKIEGDKIILNFTAKKGVPARYEVRDKTLADWLLKRKGKFKEGLFPDTSANSLNKYFKKMAGGKKYTIKDFRTYHGTRIAFEELKKYEKINLSPKRKKKVIKNVLDKVSSFLHNSPSMAKKSYIDPMVWEIIGGA